MIYNFGWVNNAMQFFFVSITHLINNKNIYIKMPVSHQLIDQKYL